MADGILSQIISGVQKLPGNIVGAPVDIANILVNSLRAGVGYVGKESGLIKSASDLPDLIEKPVLGSEWINEKFGLKNTGPIDSATQAVTGMVTPGGIAKAVIVPALFVKGETAARIAQKMLDAGVLPKEVFKHLGISQGLEESAPLKAVIPDTNASLGNVLRTSTKNPYYTGPADLQSTTVTLPDTPQRLGDVLNHPELFEAIPSLKDIKVVKKGSPGSGTYYSDTKTIEMGPAIGTKGTTDLKGNSADINAEENFTSVLLHETQHAIQDLSGFTQGGNPGMFLRNYSKTEAAMLNAKVKGDTEASNKLKGLLDNAYDQYLNIGGELEAQIVQAQRKNPKLLQIDPATLQRIQAEGKITDPKDAIQYAPDKATQGLIDFYGQ